MSLSRHEPKFCTESESPAGRQFFERLVLEFWGNDPREKTRPPPGGTDFVSAHSVGEINGNGDKSEIGHDFSRPRHPHRSECSALRSVRIGITTRDPSILQSSLPRSVRIGITTRDQSSNPGLIVRSVRSKQVTSRSVQICSDLKSSCEINPIP